MKINKLSFKNFINEIYFAGKINIKNKESLRQKNKLKLIPDEEIGKHVSFNFSKIMELLNLILGPLKEYLQPFPEEEIKKIFQDAKNSKNKLILNAKQIFLLKMLMNKIISINKNKNSPIWKKLSSAAEDCLEDIEQSIYV